jgi:hypothetical protein
MPLINIDAVHGRSRDMVQNRLDTVHHAMVRPSTCHRPTATRSPPSTSRTK